MSILDQLSIDCKNEVDRIAIALRTTLRTSHRQGAVLGISGGVDSSVCLALAARAVGPARVLGLIMPDRESAFHSAVLAQTVAAGFGVRTDTIDITETLCSLGAYSARDAAIRSAFPDYADGWAAKVVMPSLERGPRMSYFELVVSDGRGRARQKRLSAEQYLAILAATNYKQRVRKMIEYYHADRLNYGVIGTPNRLEFDLGFFVKQGDGVADIKPIAHLYKTQVYQLAEYLGVPQEVRSRQPTTDTYSMPQSQEEFFFSLPYSQMDACLFAKDHGMTAAEVAKSIQLEPTHIDRVFADIDQKRRATKHLHATAVVIDQCRGASV